MELDLPKSWAEKLNLLPAFLRAKHQLFLWSTSSSFGAPFPQEEVQAALGIPQVTPRGEQGEAF